MLNKSMLQNMLFVLPSLLIYGVFLLAPLLFSIWASFTAWDGTSWPVFIGVQNFVRMFSDATFWTSIANNALLLLFYTLCPIVIGLALCSFLNDTRHHVERSLLRILFFLPYIMPMAVLGVVWRWLYNPAFGPIDQLLRAIGQPQLAVAWLGDFNWRCLPWASSQPGISLAFVWCCLWPVCNGWIPHCLRRRSLTAQAIGRNLCALLCRPSNQKSASRCC